VDLYIFQDNFLSAFLLSGAVQGALFGMSTEFFKILNKYPRKISKIAVIAIWLFLLIFSSGFSYVGISKTAYSDDVLEEDAEQVLIMYCLDNVNNLTQATTTYCVFLLIGTGFPVPFFIQDHYLN